MKKEVQQLVAYHEAGHAVVARVLGVDVIYAATFPTGPNNSANVRTASAAYRARGGGVAVQIAGCEADAKVQLAGPHAQHRYCPVKHRAYWKHEWRGDLDAAKQFIGHSILIRDGIEPRDGLSITLTPDQQTAGETTLTRVIAETEALVEAHWPAIERVAETLVRRPMIGEDDLDALIANRPLLNF